MSPHTTWKLLLLQHCLWPLPWWEVLKVSIWHPGSYLGSLRTQNRKSRLIPISVTLHTYHHLYYKENFFKGMEFSEFDTCYDLSKEGHRLNFSLHLWLWSPFWSLLDEIVLSLTVFFRIFKDWSLREASFGVSDLKLSDYRWVQRFWHIKVQQVLTFILKQKVEVGDVAWVTLQANFNLHWTRMYLIFTPIWTHQELHKKLHLGDGSIEQTQCALSSDKPRRVNQWDLKVQCNLRSDVFQSNFSALFLQIKWKKLRQNDQVFRCGSRISAQYAPWCLSLVWLLLMSEVTVGFSLTFSLCGGIYMLKN